MPDYVTPTPERKQNVILEDIADGIPIDAPIGGLPSATADGANVTLGAKADTAATTDAGTFSLIALTKRLLGKFPALGQALSAASQPVVIASDQSAIPTTNALGSTAANQTTGNAALTAINGKLPTTTLGQPSVARSITVNATSASVTLTASCTRISLVARTADVRFRVGTGAQTAVVTDHFIAAGERIDIQVPASAVIAAIRGASTDGVLLISELL